MFHIVNLFSKMTDNPGVSCVSLRCVYTKLSLANLLRICSLKQKLTVGHHLAVHKNKSHY